MIVEPWIKFGILVWGAVVVAFFVVKYFRPHPGADLRNIESLGTWGEVQFDVMTNPRGRRFVSVYLRFEGSEPANYWGLMGSREALKVARMLRVAAAPGKNLAAARYAFTVSRRGPSARDAHEEAGAIHGQGGDRG